MRGGVVRARGSVRVVRDARARRKYGEILCRKARDMTLNLPMVGAQPGGNVARVLCQSLNWALECNRFAVRRNSRVVATNLIADRH